MARCHFSYSILDSLYMYIYVLKRKMKRNRKLSYSSLKKLNIQIGRGVLELMEMGNGMGQAFLKSNVKN